MLVTLDVTNGTALWVFDQDIASTDPFPPDGLLVNGESASDYVADGLRFLNLVYPSGVSSGDPWSVPTDPGITFAGGLTLSTPESGVVI